MNDTVKVEIVTGRVAIISGNVSNELSLSKEMKIDR